MVLLRSFGQSLTRWSGLLHLKQFWFFFWYNLTVLTKWTIHPTDWSASPPPPGVSASSPAEDSASSSPSHFAPESSSSSLLSTVADQAVKVQLLLSLWEGNKFPGVWEQLCSILQLWWSLAAEDLWLLSVIPIFEPLGVDGSSQLGVLYQLSLVFVVKALIEVIMPHLLYVLQLDPSWILWLEYLDLLSWVHPKFSHILPWSLLEGMELFTKGVECHFYA